MAKSMAAAKSVNGIVSAAGDSGKPSGLLAYPASAGWRSYAAKSRNQATARNRLSGISVWHRTRHDWRHLVLAREINDALAY